MIGEFGTKLIRDMRYSELWPGSEKPARDLTTRTERTDSHTTTASSFMPSNYYFQGNGTMAAAHVCRRVQRAVHVLRALHVSTTFWYERRSK